MLRRSFVNVNKAIQACEEGFLHLEKAKQIDRVSKGPPTIELIRGKSVVNETKS